MSELAKEFEATVAARQETGEELEPHLVEQFAEKVEAEIERRARELAGRQRRPREHRPITPLVLGSLGIGIPLIGAAGGTAGPTGVIAVCIAIVLINLFWAVTQHLRN